MNQPKTYTAASNQRYILRELWHYDRSTIFYALAEIITQIGKGFGTILIPSMIVAFLEQYQKGMITQETLPGAVAKLVTFFVGYSIWCIITGYLKRRNQFQYVKFRCGTMIECTYQKYMSLDYVQCEDEKVQQLLKKAGEAVSGNYRHRGCASLRRRTLKGSRGIDPVRIPDLRCIGMAGRTFSCHFTGSDLKL